MKKIVITGGSGRFGEVLKRFKTKHKLYFPTKRQLNILNFKKIQKYLKKIKPDIIIHYAEQPSAPYSMMGRKEALFTLNNNLNVTANIIFAVKLYPSGATTNSFKGVKKIREVFDILEPMEKHNIPLLIHGEVNDKNIDIFDREKIFIEEELPQIYKNFPNLKITLEHITTKYAVNFINNTSNNIKASITPHHLILNRMPFIKDAKNLNTHFRTFLYQLRNTFFGITAR